MLLSLVVSPLFSLSVRVPSIDLLVSVSRVKVVDLRL